MIQMLTSEILKQNIKYNDDIEYVAGDYIYAPTKDVCHSELCDDDYIGYAVDYFANHCPPLCFQNSLYQKSNLKYLTSNVNHIRIDLDFLILDDFKNIIINTFDKSFDLTKICNDRYDGINYYAPTDTLEIPKIIKDRIDLGECINVNMAIYNIDKAIVNHSIFNNLEQSSVPNLNFDYISKNIKYSFFEKEYKTELKIKNQPTFYCQYQNLLNSDYKSIKTDYQTLAYDVQEGIFYGHSNANQTKLNVLCNDIAKNGLLKPIQMKKFKNGDITPYFSNKRFLIALYLNLPLIPICIITDDLYDDTFLNYMNIK